MSGTRDNTRLWRAPVEATMLSSMLLLIVSGSFAGALRVEPSEHAVTVLLDGEVLGPAPLERSEVPPGEHTLGFRATAFGQTLFTETVQVPEAGVLVVTVDLPARQVSWRGEAEATPPEELQSDQELEEKASPSEAVAEPEPSEPVGDLFVGSDPPGSLILLNGEDTGLRTPAMLSAVPAGTHTVELRTECAKARGEVMVREGVIERLELTMKEGTGTLSVNADPESAEILLDGTAVGRTPAVFPRLSCGEHELVLRAPGRLEMSERVMVLAYEQHVVSVSLPIEQYGTLAIAPTPLGAEVTLDDIVLGTGPRTIEQVGAGEHRLRVAHDGYRPHEQVVEIPPDDILRVDVSLEPERGLPWGRLALDVGATGAGAALAGLSVREYLQARASYQDFLSVEDDAEAEAIYQDQVVPQRRAAILEGAGAAALLAGAGVLWWTTDFGIAPTPGGVAVTARW